MDSSRYEQLRAVVHGRVQGVNFRAYTVEEATTLGLTGWVRNCPDRTVEVCAEGPREQLERLLQFLYHGSPSAQVTSVDVQWLPATHRYRGFEVRYGYED